MTSPARRMLEDMHGIIQTKFEDSIQTWDKFIEFLAVDHSPALLTQLDHRFEWFFEDKDLSARLVASYKPEMLKAEHFDHLGDMYMERLVSKKDAERRGIFLTPMEVATLMAAMTIPKTDKKVNVLDPCVGTGRLLMAGYRQAPNGVYFGVDINLRALRIAYANFAIHGIKGYLLHADSLRHETDIGTEAGRKNWGYANSWHSCMDKLELMNCSGAQPPTSQSLESKLILTQQNDLFNPQQE